MTGSGRPPGLRRGDAPEVDPETGDFLFRFPLPDVPADAEEDLFRLVVEHQLCALLDIVELCDGNRPLRVTGYRLLSEPQFRRLPDDSDAGIP